MAAAVGCRRAVARPQMQLAMQGLPAGGAMRAWGLHGVEAVWGRDGSPGERWQWGQVGLLGVTQPALRAIAVASGRRGSRLKRNGKTRLELECPNISWHEPRRPLAAVRSAPQIAGRRLEGNVRGGAAQRALGQPLAAAFGASAPARRAERRRVFSRS